MKNELGNLFHENNMTIPPGFENLRHTVAGGTAGTLAANQQKVKTLMEDVPISHRGRKRMISSLSNVVIISFDNSSKNYTGS